MRVKQIGNGGGFDFDKTNSAFLINHGKDTILFDCGFNIMEKLKSDDSINIEEIDYVYISHTDEDHIGNLKMFIYWRYFNFDKKTIVLCSNAIKSDINDYLKHMNTELIGCQSTPANMFRLCDIMQGSQLMVGAIGLTLTPAFHGSIPTSGLIFAYNDNGNYNYTHKGFISADTKANRVIEELTKDCSVIFHDYSNWDCVTRNVHACKTDYEIEYSKEFRNKAIKYHNGEDFFTEWYSV